MEERKEREIDRQTDRQRGGGGVVEDKIRKNLYRENE